MRLETLAAAGPAGIGLALPTKPYMRIATALHIPVNTYVHRGLAQVWDGKCELVSRRRSSYERFWDLHGSLAKLKVKDAIIDGEIVCLDSEGRSICNELLFRRAVQFSMVRSSVPEWPRSAAASSYRTERKVASTN